LATLNTKDFAVSMPPTAHMSRAVITTAAPSGTSVGPIAAADCLRAFLPGKIARRAAEQPATGSPTAGRRFTGLGCSGRVWLRGGMRAYWMSLQRVGGGCW
jgi:hypothetical protein